MQIKEFHWNNDNGNQIYAVEWPVAGARAVVGLVHGLGEHVRRYDELATFLQENDIAVVGYDRQGFGRSEGKKGFAADYKEFVDEVARLSIQCQTRYPDLPVFLYGHSMGGQILLRYLVRRHPDISGAIVSAPHIRLPKAPSPFLVGFGRIMKQIAPAFTQPNTVEVSALSRNPQVAKNYTTDPYVHDKISSQTGLDMLDNATVLDRYANGVRVPTLLMHGDADRITSHAGSAAFAERNPKNLVFKSWPGFYHELHNEPERREVFEYVLRWMEDHMSTVHRRPESI